MKQLKKRENLDIEWLWLIITARNIGITKDEIRQFLRKHSLSNNMKH
ncbi:MAG: anti-repressor SinI family protein [Bacillota bacterium]|uniref:Anti-repressor SinI family protein n=1 Tax=Virgibacillus salarius TaxID=447199 RepID=A0A941DVL1_9BACI|nr:MULTISPECIES: anti-repressor SinI family protein [Bacillaceae]NAZ09245.1 DNA-binding anti-repressor SinI [Agaribacter marinus]MBR7796536.1 anti-repressor SinI family protein [Virgibacillus salarius]MCC2251717.1 anti-repressor SinI family protein [Virgibacillus sp. AGTR]MDY7042630.1 anti-repressor SinI family protein [Virgibacillus sp. M23]QRZ17091.1 anti-repressor SinI family protein [Virgibacillus sp. AGTR]